MALKINQGTANVQDVVLEGGAVRLALGGSAADIARSLRSVRGSRALERPNPELLPQVLIVRGWSCVRRRRCLRGTRPWVRRPVWALGACAAARLRG